MRREAALLLGGLGLALAFVAWPGETQRLGPRTSCTRAVVMDGELRCDDEAVLAVHACGSELDAIAGDVIVGCTARARMSADDLELLEVPIDVNAASREDLASLRGVGPVVAARVVEQRPYASADDLLLVKGIGPKTLAAMRPRVALDPPRIR